MGRCTRCQAWLGLLMLGLATSSVSGARAQVQVNNQALLESRRAQARQVIQQGQVSLRTQLECISTARSLDELDRCQRGMPRMGPGMHGWGAGGWGCPPW